MQATLQARSRFTLFQTDAGITFSYGDGSELTLRSDNKKLEQETAWGGEVEIRARWEGRFLERVAPGALDKTLAERGDKIKVLFNHGFDPQIGDKPLGKPEVMEPRTAGLWTETPLADTSYNKDIRALLASGAVDGMSFRFSVKREDINVPDEASDDNPDRLEERTIRELKLFEFGPVTFPAYEATTAGVRARDAYTIYHAKKVDAAPPGTSTVDTPHIVHLSQQDIDRLRRRIAQTDRRSRR